MHISSSGFLVARRFSIFRRQLCASIVERFRNTRERFDNDGVKMLARPFGDNRHRLFVAKAFLVHALGNECIEHVGNSHDSRGERNLFTLEVVRVTGAIPFFVMVENMNFIMPLLPPSSSRHPQSSMNGLKLPKLFSPTSRQSSHSDQTR